MNNEQAPQTRKIFILLVQKGDKLHKYPEGDEHLDIFELEKLVELYSEQPMIIRRLDYVTVIPEEYAAYLAGAKDMQPLVTLS